MKRIKFQTKKARDLSRLPPRASPKNFFGARDHLAKLNEVIDRKCLGVASCNVPVSLPSRLQCAIHLLDRHLLSLPSFLILASIILQQVLRRSTLSGCSTWYVLLIRRHDNVSLTPQYISPIFFF
jgi:hypothetical protein